MHWPGLADDAPTQDLRQTCIDVLCAYLQLPFTPDPGNDSAHQEQQHHRYLALRKVRHTILRLIGDHYRRPQGTQRSWQGCDLDLTGVTIDDNMDFTGTEFSDGTVNFDRAAFHGGVSFSDAAFTGGTVNFDRAAFRGGTVSFSDAAFSGGRVDFDRAPPSAACPEHQGCGRACMPTSDARHRRCAPPPLMSPPGEVASWVAGPGRVLGPIGRCLSRAFDARPRGRGGVDCGADYLSTGLSETRPGFRRPDPLGRQQPWARCRLRL